MPYFYTDANGQRQGPINDQTLLALIAQGIILRTTPMETEGGHRGLAGQLQIPGIVWPAPPTPLQELLHCTNCGTVVSRQADSRKCLSCGFKSTGHRKFCRSCGTGISSKQEICVRCGTAVPSTWTILTENLSNFFSVGTASSLAIAKFAVGWGLVLGIIAALWWFFFPIYFSPGSFGGNPFSSLIASLNRAKPGDWVKYETTIMSPEGNMEKGNVTYRVVSKDGKKIRLQITMDTGINRFGPGGGRPQGTQSHEVEIDLSKSPKELIQSLLEQPEIPRGPRDFMKNVDLAIKRGRTSRGAMSVAGEKFNCAITSYTFTMTVGNIAVTIRDFKEWTSEKVPVFGSVKMEWQTTVPMPINLNDVDSGVKMKTFSITTTLVEYGW